MTTDEPLPQPMATTPARAADHSPVPSPEAPGPIPEETMPDHLIFDYFTSAESEAAETTRGAGCVRCRAFASAATVGSGVGSPAAPGSAAAGSGPTPPAYGAQMASGSYPQGPRPPGSPPPRPGPYPSPGQYPPGNTHPGNTHPGRGDPAAPVTRQDRRPSSVRGARPGRTGRLPARARRRRVRTFGSRRRLILIIAGVVVLVGAAVVAGVLISRSGQPSSTPRRASSSQHRPASLHGTPSASPSVTPSGSASASAGASASSRPPRARPEAAVVGGDSGECGRSSRCGSTAGQTAPCTWSTPRARSSRSSCRAPRRQLESDHAGKPQHDHLPERWRPAGDGRRRLWRSQAVQSGSRRLRQRGACVMEPDRPER